MSEGNVFFLSARKLITVSTMLKRVWAFTMIVGERTRNSSTRGIVQQQIWRSISCRFHCPTIYFTGVSEAGIPNKDYHHLFICQ